MKHIDRVEYLHSVNVLSSYLAQIDLFDITYSVVFELHSPEKEHYVYQGLMYALD
jgi:hypothetical protein